MGRKKKICILQNGLKYGGTDTFVIYLSNGINREKYDVDLIISGHDNDILRADFVKNYDGKVFQTCDLKGLKNNIKHLKKLYRILKDGKYDVFQTNIDLFNGFNLLVAWFAGVPVRVCHSHNSQQGRELQGKHSLRVLLYQRVMRWFCWKFSNRRCGCSELAMNFLFEDKWKSDVNSRVVHNGIELEEYRQPIDITKKKTDLKLRNRYNIVTVGRIAFQKNPEFIVEIFREVCKIRDDCDLVWVGTGDLVNHVTSMLDKYDITDRTHLLGVRSDVNEILQVCDVFLLPSRFEGLGIVLIEAQAAGLPCVVSNVVPGEANCGSCCYIELDKPAYDWAMKISEILDKKIKLVADEVMVKQYSVNHMVKEMEEVFGK